MSFKGIRKPQKSKSNVSEHIKHVFEEEELAKEATVRKFRTVQMEGSRCVEREVEHYNLDMIIALGFTLFFTTYPAIPQEKTKDNKRHVLISSSFA